MVPASAASRRPRSSAEASFTLPADKPSGAKDNLKVALVRQSGIGDYFEQWGSGAKAQLEAAGATVDIYDARNDNAKQATDFNTAIASKPDVIIVDHGLKDTIDPKVDEAIKAGIPVVVYDVAVGNQDALYLSQDDESIANKILGYMKGENPDGGKIAYVNVPASRRWTPGTRSTSSSSRTTRLHPVDPLRQVLRVVAADTGRSV